MKAKFTLLEVNPKYILIEDHANEFNSMSVTNDAENVVEYIVENYGLTNKQVIYYIDTDGFVDILGHINGIFTTIGFGFKDITEFKNSQSYNTSEKTYSRNEVISIIHNVLEATGKTIKAEMKNIPHNSYIEFDGNDLETWINKNL